MEAETSLATTNANKVLSGAGWVISILPCVPLVLSTAGMLMLIAEVKANFADMSYPERVILPLGLASAASTILYLIPRTAFLGAIMLTGFFGGAIDVHVLNAESLTLVPVMCIVLVWVGLYLRDARIRSLVPLRSAMRLAASERSASDRA